MAGTFNVIEDQRVRGDVEVALEELGSTFVSSPLPKQDGGFVVFHSARLTPYDIEALNPILPDQVHQKVTVVEPDSFIDYIRNYKSPSAICMASLGNNRIEAVLNYHGRAREGDSIDARPGRCSHVVTLLCPFDADYAKWRAIFGKSLEQQQLAEFVEDMVHTIAEPAAADLLEAIADLRIDRAVRFKSGRNQRNGTIQFVYEETEAERGSGKEGTLELPDTITLVLPIFQGGPHTSLTAKIRYTLDRGALAFRVVVPGIEKVERDAFRSIGEHVRQDTETPVYYTA